MHARMHGGWMAWGGGDPGNHAAFFPATLLCFAGAPCTQLVGAPRLCRPHARVQGMHGVAGGRFALFPGCFRWCVLRCTWLAGACSHEGRACAGHGQLARTPGVACFVPCAPAAWHLTDCVKQVGFIQAELQAGPRAITALAAAGARVGLAALWEPGLAGTREVARNPSTRAGSALRACMPGTRWPCMAGRDAGWTCCCCPAHRAQRIAGKCGEKAVSCCLCGQHAVSVHPKHLVWEAHHYHD